jgi:hypothetical protein
MGTTRRSPQPTAESQSHQRASADRRRSRAVWLGCVVISALGLIIYTASALSPGAGAPILPLDDTYIHFQYARQLAAGQYAVYNPGLPPTSGATSFLYPFVLAPGIGLGFSDLWLGLWALIVGAIAHALAAFWLYRILDALGSPSGFSGALALIYAACGLPQWHAFSGMETALITAAVLGTLDALIRRRRGRALIAAALCALLRPEAAVIAGGTTLLLLSRDWLDGQRRPQRLLLDLLPIFAIGVQPLINGLVTGTFVASGSSAKSVFGMVPLDLGAAIARVVAQFVRMAVELFATSNSIGMAVFSALLIAAPIGWITLAARRSTRGVGLTVALWWLGGLLLIATLDTAFWHFKRYQIPFFALTVVLAGVGVSRLALHLPRLRTAARALYLIALAGAALVSAVEFVRDHALNVGYVYAQPYQMARFLADQTDPAVVVAVHDVGMMRYIGGRTTFDLVGLTTPGAAASWRSGPGAIGELIERVRPDLIAAYGSGHGTGLGYLAATDLYAEPLAEYRVDWIDGRGVALAAPLQGIYRPRWDAADVVAPVLAELTPWLDDLTPVTRLDVADLTSEQEHGYTWDAAPGFRGFATEYFQFPRLGDPAQRAIMDGGRRITGHEAFTVTVTPGQDVLWIIRAHAAAAGTIAVDVNGAPFTARVIPQAPGYFIEIPILIPAAQVTGELALRVAAGPGLIYQPYQHWIYQGTYTPAPIAAPLLTYQDGAIALTELDWTFDPAAPALTLTLTWASAGTAQGDAALFIHLVDADGAIVAQHDARPGGGALPPGNWIAGAFRDTITLNIDALPPGTYTLFMGLYDPVSLNRLMPDESSSLPADSAGRVRIDMLTLD